MKTLRIISAALAVSLGMGISSTSQAFMASPVETQTADAETQLTTTLENLREEIVVGDTKVDVMVAKLDAFVKHIDQMLDDGVQNEDLYLAAREEAITLRQSLPGLDKYLAGVEAEGGPLGGSVVSDTLLSEQTIGTGGGFTSGGGGYTSGGVSFSGGGGSAGISRRSGIGLLGTISAAIAIPLATSSDDHPGPIGSQSVAN